MTNTDNLGPEYHNNPDKDRLKGRRFVWSRKKSKPWSFTMFAILALITAAGAMAVSYLVLSHPGKPEPNVGIEEPVRE